MENFDYKKYLKNNPLLSEAVSKNRKGRGINKVYVDRISSGGMSQDYPDTQEFEDNIIDDIKEMMEEENSRVLMEFVYVDTNGKEHPGQIEFDELSDRATGTSDFYMDDEEELEKETQLDSNMIQDMILGKI